MQKPSSDALRKAVVVAASCVVSFLLFGTTRLSAQLFQVCRERFNVGRKEASLPFVLAFTVKNISGPFVGYLGNKFGLRCVTILGCTVSAVSVGACYFVEDIISFTVLWGGFLGIGFGMGCILISNILHDCFTTNFNKMQGIFLAFGCVGSFVLPGITEYLLKTYGSGTFLILSGFVLHCIPAAMLLKPPEKSEQLQIQSEIKEMGDTNRTCKEIKTTSIELQKEIPDSDKHLVGSDSKKNSYSMAKLHSPSNSKSRNFQIFLDPAYILTLISLSLALLGIFTMYTMIADACRDKGITEDVIVLMTFAIMDMLGRIFSGYIADVGCISPLNIYALCCGCCGLLMLGFTWLDNYYVVLAFIGAIGAMMGGIMVLPVGIIKDYVPKEHLTIAFSSRFFLFGCLNLSQPPVIGYFRDTLHSYDGLFYLLGSMCLLSAIIALLVPSAARFRNRRRINYTNDANEGFGCNH